METKEKRLDNIWSQAVKEIADYKCELCGNKNSLSAHHIINKSISKGLRWKIKNGMCLCFSCHRMAHDQPKKFKEKIKKMDRDIDYKELEHKGSEICKYIDLKKEEENIKTIWIKHVKIVAK